METTTVGGTDMAKPDTSRPTEDALRRALDCARNDRDDSVCVHADVNPVVGADFLRRLLVEASTAPEPRITRFVLWSATIDGWLTLEGTELKLTPSFVQCTFDTGINLTDATVVGFEMIGGSVPMVHADRLTASGSVLLRKALADPTYGHPQPAPGLAPIAITKQVLLCGAKIHGNLDLRGSQLGDPNTAHNDPCCVLADGIAVEGNLLLGDGLRSTGEVRLNGCEISRNLDCRGANMTNPGGRSLSAAGGHVHGSVKLIEHCGEKFTSTGTFHLDGAKVDGNIDATAGEFTAGRFAASHPLAANVSSDQTDALTGDGLSVGGDLLFKDGFRATGAVNLINARIGGDFNCGDCCFDLPGEEALTADGITVNGATFLNNGARTNGLLRFIQANLSQGFFIDGAVFGCEGEYNNYLGENNVSASELGNNVCGIYATGATIGGTFLFRGTSRWGTGTRTVWLSMEYATADIVEDDQDSWDAAHRINVIGCNYKSILAVTKQLDRRLCRLDREYIGKYATQGRSCAALAALVGISNDDLVGARERFSPQPYMQLAQVVRTAGYEDAANRILIRLERHRTCFGGILRRQQIWRWLLDPCFRYGYSTWRPLAFLIFWIFVSAWHFHAEFEGRRLTATHDNQSPVSGTSTASPSPMHPEVQFNCVVYAIDTLVPVVDLNQKKNFVFKKTSWWVVINSFLGWIISGLLAAGVSGLARPRGAS